MTESVPEHFNLQLCKIGSKTPALSRFSEFPRTPYAGNPVSETMGVEEWANCRRGHLWESKCGMMCLTQEQPLLPPIKEERLLPTSSVQYTQEGWVSENTFAGSPLSENKCSETVW